MARETITSLDVARLAGVSQSAVSRVFTPGASVSQKTAAKVRSAATQLGYSPNAIARSLMTGRSRIVALVVAYLDNQFYPDALEKLSRALQAKGYHLLVFIASNNEGGVDQVLNEILGYQVDGVILASVSVSSELALRCGASGIPVVLFNRGQDDPSLSRVTSDNYLGGRRIGEFLVAGGHRRIAHISGWTGSMTGRDRAVGFETALRENGLSVYAQEDGSWQRTKAEEAARRIFSCPDRPDAVFVASDNMAFAVMDVLRYEFGLSVPDDVSVVGYDDVPMASWGAYRLTTMRQPLNRMVDATVSAIMSHINGEDTEPRHIALEGQLKVRGSARIPEGFEG